MRNDHASFDSRLDHCMDVKRETEKAIKAQLDMAAPGVMKGVEMPGRRPEGLKANADGPRSSTSGLHIDTYLTNMSMAYVQDMSNFVASRLYAMHTVQKRSDKYLIYDVDNTLRSGQQPRADFEPSQGSGSTFSEDTYYCDWFSSHRKLGVIAMNEQDRPPVDLERWATRELAHDLLLKREIDFVATAMPDGITQSDKTASPWTDANTKNGASDNIFSEGYTGDIISDILEANENAAVKNGGHYLNTLALSPEARRNLATNDDILMRINGGATTVTPALVTDMMIAAALEIDAVYTIKAVNQTAPIGASAAALETGRKFICSNKALLYHRDPMLGPEGKSAVGLFAWDVMGMPSWGGGLSRFYDQKHRCDFVEADQFYGLKVTGETMAVYWPGAVTAVSA